MVGSGFETLFSPLLWLALAMVVALPSLAVLHAWLVDNTIEAHWAIGIFVAQICGMALMLNTRGLQNAFVYGATLLMLCAVLPLLFLWHERHEIRRLDREEIECLRGALVFDDKNAGARARLAEKMVEAKPDAATIAEATSLLQSAIALSPDGPQSKAWRSQLAQLQHLEPRGWRKKLRLETTAPNRRRIQ